MLSLAEYIAAKSELTALVTKIEKDFVAQFPEQPSADAAKYAASLASKYKTDFWALLGKSMGEVAQNAYDHYQKKTGILLDPDIVDKIIEAQFEDEYYGATLAQRLAYNEQLLHRRLSQSAAAKQLHTVYTGPQFGSQLATDQRLLLGTLVKVEQDVAREYAGETDHKLIQWALSHKHAKPDACDDLATNIDRRVVEYIQEHDLKIDPKGVYFVDDLPVPPHPNCQCEYGIVTDRIHKPGVIERTIHNAAKILRRIWKK